MGETCTQVVLMGMGLMQCFQARLMFVLMHLGEDSTGMFCFYYLRIFHARSMCIFLFFAHDDARYGLTTFHTHRNNQGLGLQTARENQHFEVQHHSRTRALRKVPSGQVHIRH
jgi:hypothetical protein